jgi:radical SAM superfamily enzyme YgiQ (UPF0313 family)
MGGAHPRFYPMSADFVMRGGEGEHSLVELIEHLEKGTPAFSGWECPGTYWRPVPIDRWSVTWFICSFVLNVR